jgi:hypothetical protein
MFVITFTTCGFRLSWEWIRPSSSLISVQYAANLASSFDGFHVEERGANLLSEISAATVMNNMSGSA